MGELLSVSETEGADCVAIGDRGILKINMIPYNIIMLYNEENCAKDKKGKN